MERTLGVLVPSQNAGERLEGRPAEWEIRTALGSCAEAGNHHAIEAEGGDPVTDAFLRAGNYGANLGSQVLECFSTALGHTSEVFINSRKFALCNHVQQLSGIVLQKLF